MYPPKFEYHRAGSVAEAVTLLQQHAGAKLLAGGHSLLPVMKLRLADPGTLIDIGRIAELKGISTANGSVRIGALTTHATVEQSDAVPAALSQAAGWIGDHMVRNRGTVGGSVTHADPASDLPTVLTALNATFHITGPSGDRTVSADDFFSGFFETAVGEDEILTAIDVPAEGPGAGSAYAKLFNPASRFALVGAAAALQVSGGNITSARVALGGLTSHATRASAVEAALVGQPTTAATVAAAAAAVAGDLGDDVTGDLHASADYRRQVTPDYVSQALTQALERAG